MSAPQPNCQPIPLPLVKNFGSSCLKQVIVYSGQLCVGACDKVKWFRTIVNGCCIVKVFKPTMILSTNQVTSMHV